MYDITCNQLDPYKEAIALFFKSEFPVLVNQGDSQMLDLLTGAIIASGKVRFGPQPSPESQVAIREVISHWMAKGEPIPFLVPWGSEKPNGTGVDVAELMALKTLTCLNHRIRKFYSAGAVFRIRVEDASAPHLFFDRVEAARREAALYTNGFVTLAKAIEVDKFVNIVPESTMTTEQDFSRKADEILPVMSEHVINPSNQWAIDKLAAFGWRVPLSADTLGYYLERYAKLYPDKSGEEKNFILARYFSAALARIALGVTGVHKDWGKEYLELSFAQPTPGIGANRGLRRLYYRTMPSHITSNHMPAWRAKGYLKINGHVTASLTSFHDTELEFNPNVVMMSNGELSQDVQADYVVTD